MNFSIIGFQKKIIAGESQEDHQYFWTTKVLPTQQLSQRKEIIAKSTGLKRIGLQSESNLCGHLLRNFETVW
jgi:hypothetical protein